MNVAIGADHAGVGLKAKIAADLAAAGHQVTDVGTFDESSVDYPDIAAEVATAVAAGRADRGVLICGTGIGMAMTAGKHAGIRAATCNDLYTARMARAHNDANVLTLGERVVGPGVAADIVALFLATPFEGGRHARRVAKIDARDAR